VAVPPIRLVNCRFGGLKISPSLNFGWQQRFHHSITTIPFNAKQA
jgi:hypothetical protein